MKAPIITRKEIVFLLFHAYTLETIQLGRQAYDKWRELYDGTEYDPPYDFSNRFTVGLRDTVQRRENLLRQVEKEGGNTTEFMDSIRAKAGEHLKFALQNSYPEKANDMETVIKAELDEQKRSLEAIVEKARKFVNEAD